MKTSKMIVTGVAIALFACGSSVYAQKGKAEKKPAYEVKFIMQQGMPDSVLYVAYYYADKTYMFDTLYVERKVPYTFIMKGDSARMERGMYILAAESKVKYLDFLVDSSFFFTIKVGNTKESTVYINSPENTLIGEFEKGMTTYYSKGQPLVEVLRTNESLSEDEKEKLRAEIKLCQDSMQLFRTDFLQKHESTLFAKIIRMGEDIANSIPDPPRNPDGTIVDSAWSYQYYLHHYWDNTDLSEPALLRTPSTFYQRLTYYFDNVVMPIPDTINKYVDLLIERVKHPDLLRYIIQYITHKYETSQYVGHDAVFVHMVKKYYEKGSCPWVDEEVLKALIERANHLDLILIGRVAPYLVMPDTNGAYRSNYDFNKKYTIMWFWDLNCGHCKTATPILKEFYDRAKDSLDFEVYAVCMGTDTVKWKQAIIEKGLNWINVGKNTANIDFREVYGVTTTPVVFIIDREKKIIAKKIEAKEIENVIRNHEAGKRIR